MMNRIDVNDLLGEDFAEEMILKTEKRVQRRKRVKSICFTILLVVLGAGLLQLEQVSQAAENLIYYAFGKTGESNIISEEIYLLNEPLELEGNTTEDITLEYAYLVEGTLTLHFESKYNWPENASIELVSGGKTYRIIEAVTAGTAKYTSGYDEEDYTSFSDGEGEGVVYSAKGKKEYEVGLNGILDNQFKLIYRDKDYSVSLEPAGGYKTDRLFTDKCSYYHGTAMLLDKKKAAFGVHIDSMEQFSDWMPDVSYNPFDNKSNIYFLGNHGTRYDAARYHDDNSFLPESNLLEDGEQVSPDFMCISGVNFEKFFGNSESQQKISVKLPEIGETVKINKTVTMDGVKVRLLEMTVTEDKEFRIKVNCGSNYGRISSILCMVGADGYQEEQCSMGTKGPFYGEDSLYAWAEPGVQRKEKPYVYSYCDVGYDAMKEQGIKSVDIEVWQISVYMDIPMIFKINPDSYEMTED
ncbi:MAG: hypothetical protein ACI4A3_13895 [Lachnospiraceae bacterium]